MSKIKWSKRKLKALRGSIQKWEKIVDGTGMDKREENCPLCLTYPECSSCPIAETVDRNGCWGTPWIKWTQHQHQKHLSHGYMKVECPTCKRLAKKELNFLKGLLPEEEQHD